MLKNLQVAAFDLQLLSYY